MASEKWAGFTDDDIKMIHTKPTALSPTEKSENNEDIGNATNQTGPIKITEVSVKPFRMIKPVSDSSKDDTSDSDPEFKQKSHRLKKGTRSKETLLLERQSDDSEHPSPVWNKNGADYSDDSCASCEGCKKENSSENNFESNTNYEELELFEVRQNRIKAANSRRRALIHKAITDKKMRTEAEATKLAMITQELNRLDSILSADVSILRNYIEKATLEFSEAEKRYLAAEKEFIESKMLLFEKMQRKEQLTEHLCAIIEQNENRKANKLVELMQQLEMEAIIEDYDTKQSEPILSKFCALNEEAYRSCQTLKKPYSKSAPSSPTSEHPPPGGLFTNNLENSMENESFESIKSN